MLQSTETYPGNILYKVIVRESFEYVVLQHALDTSIVSLALREHFIGPEWDDYYVP